MQVRLFNQCQHSLAKKYVSEGKMNMTEITFMLGFSELSSFSRAYKRWTGHSPRNEL
ncbi:MAG: helix-turn-helix domain-containing protein [Gammaproteobacteria bacterium]|nr:helix-turn-helix domain-containing protein [Gammaproteobacteria bacterium]